MLAVVDHQVPAGERGGGTAEAGPGFGQRDPVPLLGEGYRRGDAGQPAAQHGHVRPRGHRTAPAAGLDGPDRRGRGGRTTVAARDLTATSAFSPADSETRRLSTAAGLAAMCSSSRK